MHDIRQFMKVKSPLLFGRSRHSSIRPSSRSSWRCLSQRSSGAGTAHWYHSSRCPGCPRRAAKWRGVGGRDGAPVARRPSILAAPSGWDDERKRSRRSACQTPGVSSSRRASVGQVTQNRSRPSTSSNHGPGHAARLEFTRTTTSSQIRGLVVSDTLTCGKGVSFPSSRPRRVFPAR
jgi:hypothetical protein